VTESFEVHVDARGALLPIRLDELAFTPCRAFVVVGPDEGSTRGGHVVSCREQVVLMTGRAELRYAGRTIVLDTLGATVLLEPGQPMDYDLAPGGSSILVLAEEPYAGVTEEPG
jgi:WxcM-like, C-terminal